MTKHLVSVLAVVTAAGVASAAPVIRSNGGIDAAAILGMVDQFRADLGAPNNGVGGGPFATGRREINWDANALDPFASPNLMPVNFFNRVPPPAGSPRGAEFSTPGTGFLVSQRTEIGGPSNIRFGDINPAYTSLFQTFSSQRLFAAKDSTVTDVTFFVPSSPGTAATVSGFGAVFADVDLDSSSKIDYYDLNNDLLLSQSVTNFGGGLSFLGASFDNGERVARVRITAGNFALGANTNDGFFKDTGFQDLVAMDDFFYGEPQAVPAPGAGLLAVVGGVMLRRRRR